MNANYSQAKTKWHEDGILKGILLPDTEKWKEKDFKMLKRRWSLQMH